MGLFATRRDRRSTARSGALLVSSCHGSTAPLPIAGAPGPAGTELATSTCVQTDGTPVVSVRGELDIVTADRFYQILVAVADQHGPSLVIDMSALGFCDPCGLGALVRAANHTQAAGGEITLVGPSPLVTRLLNVSGLQRRFTIQPA